MALETAADTELRNLDSVVEDVFNRSSLGRTQKNLREVAKSGSASVKAISAPHIRRSFGSTFRPEQ
eukprot:3056727-Rhodomonas_salina.1